MNHICAFIYELCENEEESFYLFNGLMNNGNLYDIFSKDYQNLKVYFYNFKTLRDAPLDEEDKK